jgi:hypothetical protein
MSAKKRKVSDTVGALKNASRATDSNRRSKETNCGPSNISANSEYTPYDSRLMRDNPHFTYEEEYRLLGCRLCATMVTRQRIKDHLQSRPHHLNSSEIKKVQEWASQLELINDNREISGLPLLPDDTPAIDVLGPPKTGGFRCTFIVENEGGTSMCRFVGSDTRRIREHSKHEHGWDLGLKPGKTPAATNKGHDERPWRGGVLYQRLFLKGPRSEFFEVLRGTAIIV